MKELIFFAAFLLPQYTVIGGPLFQVVTDSLIMKKRDYEETKIVKRSSEQIQVPDLKSLHVTSNIRNRYAKTEVETKYLNSAEQSQEATFTIILPEAAFISGFVMNIDEKKYEAYVREKEQAAKEYQQAVKQGLTAGHVATSVRDSNKFTVSINIEPESKVIFTLTYEQLLKRKHGLYKVVINLHPGQLVDDFNINVNINETKRIVDMNAPALRSGNEIIESTKVSKNEMVLFTYTTEDQTKGTFHFSPSIDQQKEIMTGQKDADSTKGISGQFVVEYDVERDSQGGEIIVNDGYFVHFFAPSDLEPIPKHIVFVLDVSGSMMGTKIKQLREAMKVILSELNSQDHFHLVKFSSGIQVWNETWKNVQLPSESDLPEPYIANAENIQKVQEVIGKMHDEGMTNIYDALIIALRLTSKGINNNNNENQNHQPIIMFLTDGQANQGISNYNQILEMVESKNVINKAAIFALSFGHDANKEFLKELGNKNSGFLRIIYEAADSSLQLQDFYREISSPLLTNVNFIYADQMSNVTKNKFDILFKGSELVVAGKLTDSSDKFVDVQAKSFKETRKFKPHILPITPLPDVVESEKKYGNLERLWVYLTIQQLLEEEFKSEEQQTSDKQEALTLALKYSFVTSVTSLVIVKPNATESFHPQSANKEEHKTDVSVSPQSGHTIIPSVGRRGRTRSRAKSKFTIQLPVTGLTQSQYTLITYLPWLSSLLTDSNDLIIDNKTYKLGNDSITTEDETCVVNSLSLSGKCTHLIACRRIYSKLDSFNTYKKYFCTLNGNQYAGVCCINTYDIKEKDSF